MTKNNVTYSQLLDEAVDAFESACASGADCELADFLPRQSHSAYESILLELIRVDLERSWQTEERRQTEDYCMDFPDVLKSDALRSQVAYEEYRVRLHAGHPVSATDLKERLAVDIDGWPREASREGQRGCPQSPSAIDFPAEDVMRERAVTAFPEFNVTLELGRGTFGCVYLAKQRNLAERLVAIKITADTSQEPERLATVQHTAIVPVYSVHRTKDWQAMCMPYFGQATLQKVVEEIRAHSSLPRDGKQAMTWLRRGMRAHGKSQPDARFGFCDSTVSDDFIRGCCHVIATIAAGLHHAHERGVLHRDVKPANILIADDGRPMLLDFNLSSDSANHLAGTGIWGGTLPYMSPEQLSAFQSDETVGHHSDIYSLGVILFELLTGQLPFRIPERHDDNDELIEHLIAQRKSTIQRPESRPRIRSINNSVPPAVAAIVDRCLQPAPANRYASAKELSEDLEADLFHFPLRHSPNPSPVELLHKWRRRHPRLISLSSLAVVVCLATVVGFIAWKSQEAHVARLEFRTSRQLFLSTAADARTLLSVPDVSTAITKEGVEFATKAIGIYLSSTAADAQNDLTERERETWKQTAGELQYLLASARLGQSRVANTEAMRNRLLTESLKANQEAKNLIEADVPSAALTLQRNEVLKVMGNIPEAETQEILLTADIKNDVDAFVTAAHAITHGQAGTVVPLLENLALRNPHDYSIWLLRGQALAATGAQEAADSCFTVCIAFHPDCWRAFFERGNLRQRGGQHQLAESDLSRVIQVRPDIAAAWVNRAISRQALGRLDDAIRDLDEAIGLGGPGRCWFLRARCHGQAGNSAAANADYQTGLRTLPTDEVSWIARGVAQLPQFPAKAVADFQQALLMNPRSADALQNIAHVWSEILQHPDDAIERLDTLIEFYPQRTQAITGRGVLHARLGHTEEALLDVQLATKLPCSPLETYQLGCVYALLSEADANLEGLAIEMLKAALRQDLALARLMSTDPDLASIQDNIEFQELLKSADTLLTRMTTQ